MHFPAPGLLLRTLALCATVAFGRAAEAPHSPEGGDALAQSFLQPSPESRLRVWWHWISGNVSREGITADLEAMQRVGIGGFNLFIVEQALPRGPVVFGSPEFYDLLQHTAEESARLGLSMEMTHSPGYSGTGGPWVPPALASQKFVWSTARVDPLAPHQPPQPETIAGYYRDIALFAFPAPSVAPAPVERNVLAPEPKPYPAPTAAAEIPPTELIDLTDRVLPDGSLDWTPPPGDWVLLRLGHTPTGKLTHPVPPEARGLECNKLDRAAVEHAFVHGFQPVLDRLGPLAGRVLGGTLIDSYESGSNEWCDDLPAEFERRTGYPLRPWLPVFAGYAVGGAEESRRFLWDYRKVIAELYSENYYTWMNQLARERGLTLTAEGNHSAGSTLTSNGVTDVPMMEFWRNGPGHNALANEAISGALLHGRPHVAAESFSQFPDAAWRVVPEMMKAGTDHAFANGVNRLYLHRFAHQPWPRIRPGMTMGYWGMWFERTLTWWDQSVGYNTYIARAQSVLQQGHTVVDALVWIGEGLPEDWAWSRVRNTPQIQTLRELSTHRLALLNGDALRTTLAVEPGGLRLPAGQRIQTVVIAPDSDFTVDSLQRLHDAVEEGLTLIGLPPAAPAGRQRNPDDLARFDRLVRALWGAPDHDSPLRRVGRGQVIATDAPADAIRLHLPAKLERESGPERLAWLHRRIGDNDVFFISAAQDEPSLLRLKFRVAPARPEIWNPETGEIRPAAIWQPAEDGTTRVTFALPPNGSAFVVFRPAPPPADPVVAVRAGARDAAADLEANGDGSLQLRTRSGGTYELRRASGAIIPTSVPPPPAARPIDGPWQVEFPAIKPAHRTQFSTLLDWSTHADESIRFHSGTAEYSKPFDLPAEAVAPGLRIRLDLGQVKNFAEVTVNGRAFPVLWRAPWVLDITDATRAGPNELRIRVTNTWVNRLIGDEHLPDDTTWRPVKAHASDHPVAAANAWPDWVVNDGTSPNGRQTFTAMKIVHRDDPLPESGLLGPVQIFFETVRQVAAEASPRR